MPQNNFLFNNPTFWLYETKKKKRKEHCSRLFLQTHTEEENMKSHKSEENYMESPCILQFLNQQLYLITTANLSAVKQKVLAHLSAVLNQDD